VDIRGVPAARIGNSSAVVEVFVSGIGLPAPRLNRGDRIGRRKRLSQALLKGALKSFARIIGWRVEGLRFARLPCRLSTEHVRLTPCGLIHNVRMGTNDRETKGAKIKVS
jgi:hypothetical protein